MVIVLSSPAFQHEQPIPVDFTCEGKDVSPPLEWRNVPGKTRSLALIVEDPDAPDPEAPERTYAHWLVFNLPPDVLELPQGVKELPEGTQLGVNDFGDVGYGGPCPPIGRHRYYFRLYALDERLQLEQPNRDELLAALKGHVIDEGELIGTYEKASPK